MIKLSDTGKKLVLVIAAIFLLLCVVITLFQLQPIFNHLAGLLLGSAFAMVKVVLMERALDKSLDMEPKYAENYAKSRYILRYFLTGVVLALAFILPNVSILTAVVGVFSLQPAAYITSILMKRDEQGKSKE